MFVYTWTEVLRRSFTDPVKLAEFLEIHPSDFPKGGRFPLLFPKRLADKVEKGNLHDPILLQFLPHRDEQCEQTGFERDAVGDRQSQKTPKLLHKYDGRVLLLVTGACAMHCRYCFRQHFPYERQKGNFSAELDYIRSDPTIREVILSGGDPLSLNDISLGRLLKELERIPHLRHLRFHSRFPVGIPERIDEAFCSLLGSLRMNLWFVVHINHPRELDEEVILRLKKLKSIGVTLFNQSVLLKGVNDRLDTLVSLSQALMDAGITPYYLHQLDRVHGVGHFEVEEKYGLELISRMKDQLPGYAVPKYVREVGGEKAKLRLS